MDKFKWLIPLVLGALLLISGFAILRYKQIVILGLDSNMSMIHFALDYGYWWALVLVLAGMLLFLLMSVTLFTNIKVSISKIKYLKGKV